VGGNEDAGLASEAVRRLSGRPSTSRRSGYDPFGHLLTEQTGRKANERGTRQVERRTAALALANESGKLVADLTSRAKVRNVRAAPTRLSRKSAHRTRTTSRSSPRQHHHLRVRINHPGGHHPKPITLATVGGMILGSMNASTRRDPHMQPERESWPNARPAGDSTNSRAVLADAHPATIVQAHQHHRPVGAVWPLERTTSDGLIEAPTSSERSMPRAQGPKPRTCQRGQTAPRRPPPAALRVCADVVAGELARGLLAVEGRGRYGFGRVGAFGEVRRERPGRECGQTAPGSGAMWPARLM